jgi:hypothetical protein
MPSRLSPQSQFNGPPQARSQDSPSSSSPHARPTITRSSTIKDSRNYVNATGVSTILGSAPQSYSQSPSPPPAFHSSSSPSTVALQSGYDSSVRPQIPPNAVLGLQHVPENNGLPISLPNPHPAASLPQQQPSYPPPRPPVALQGPTGASRNDSQSDDWMTERQDPTSAVREVVTKHGAPQYDRSEALLDFYPRSTTPQHTSVVPSAPVGPSYPFQSQSQAPVFAERERDRSRRSPPADTSPVSQAFGGGISAKSRPNRPRLETAASAPARPQYENDYDVPRQEDERSTPPQSQRSSASSYVYVHSNTSTSTAPAAIPTPPRATPPHTQTLPNRPADANIKHDEPPTPPRRESPTYHTPSESPAETVDRIVPNRTLSYTPTGPAPHHSYGPPFQYDDAPRQHDRQPQAQHLPQVLPRQVQAQQPQSHTQQRQPHSQQAQEPSQPPSVHRLVEPPLNQPQRVPDRSLPVQEEADPDADDRDVHSQRHHRTSRHASGEKWASPLLSHQPRQQSPGIYYQQPYGISVQQPYGVPIQRSSTLPQHLYSNSSHLEFDSPTPSSTLINPESDIDPERNHFTPRSPVAALPASPNNQAFFAANGAFKPRRPMDPSHFQHSYFASQMGAMPIPRGPSRTNYVPPHPQFTDANLGPANGAYNQYDAEAYRVPSSASNHQPNSRPSAPVPPTPHSATNAPTPAPQTHHHSHSQGQFISSVPEGARHIPSALSSYMSSPWPSYYPFLPAPLPPQSIVSSPSHQPVPLPKRRQSGLRYGTKKPKTRSFRAESTEPMSSSSSNDGDLTEGRARSGDDRDDEEEEEEDEWVVEDEEDLLDNEYHPKYIVNPAKRRRRFQQKWEALVKLVRPPSF